MGRSEDGKLSPEVWRAQVLENLDRAGPICRGVAHYLRQHQVEIGFADQSTGARWTVDGRIEMSAARYSYATDPADPALLGSVVHEATHLAQGQRLALSVEGEVGGWKAEFRARQELGRPIKDRHWKVVAETPDAPTVADLRRARTEMLQMTGRRYLIWLLPLRPVFSGAQVERVADHRWGRSIWLRLAAAILLLVLFAQTMTHARQASITFDEGPHLAVGYATLRTGDLRLQPVHIHPPVANALAAAPLMLRPDLPDPRNVSGWEIASLSAVTDAVVWRYPHPRGMAVASRLPIALMTLLLGAIVCRWAGDLFGPGAGLLALALYTFDPNVIAHGSLVTTDMAIALWGTAALFLTYRALRRPGWARWVAVGVVVGLALATKVSAVALLPVLLALWLLGPGEEPWPRRFLTAAGVLGLAFLALWAAYGFEIRSLPGFPLPLPAATHIEVYRSLQTHYQLGHPSFLMGRNAEHGWWFYFPVAFLLKTPLPVLILLAGAVVLTVVRVARGGVPEWRATFLRWGPLTLYPLLYVASSLLSTVNIGYRHLLPLLPLLYVWISSLAVPIWERRYDLLPLALAALLGWHVAGTVSVAPDYLAYFNVLAGGPSGGYRHLVDSNLDWGQNLWQLRDWMEMNEVEHIYYAHYTPARPSVYGIAADFLPPDPRAVAFAPFDPEPGVYAIGATVLQGPYAPDVNTYAWFRTHEPVDRLGYALFVYWVEPRPEPAWVAVCGEPAPVLDVDAVRARFGQPNLRQVTFDCRMAWVFPSGDRPGAFVLPPDAGPPDTALPPGTTLDLAARRRDGSPSYRIYRSSGASALEGAVTPLDGVSIDGPLAPVGYALHEDEGPSVTLWMAWEVVASPDRPLSLMAHLVGRDGATLGVADGLGVPIDQWQVGDVIVQRHRFDLPAGVSQDGLAFQVGAYWLDTMDRWSVQRADGTIDDHLQLDLSRE
jgi:hypothetical protein